MPSSSQLGWVGLVGLAEKKANSAPIELELELELSLAKVAGDMEECSLIAV